MASIFATPEIDGVRRSLEIPGSDLGDELSDTYWRMIDYTTDPRLDPEVRAHKVALAVGELAKHSGYIDGLLEDGATRYDTPDLKELYYGVLFQVDDLVVQDLIN